MEDKIFVKKETLEQKEQREKHEVLIEASKIEGYEEYKEKIDKALKSKNDREKAFDLVYNLMTKFQSMSLRKLSILINRDKKTTGKIIKVLRNKGRVILLTEQTQGHPYKIILKG